MSSLAGSSCYIAICRLWDTNIVLLRVRVVASLLTATAFKFQACSAWVSRHCSLPCAHKSDAIITTPSCQHWFCNHSLAWPVSLHEHLEAALQGTAALPVQLCLVTILWGCDNHFFCCTAAYGGHAAVADAGNQIFVTLQRGKQWPPTTVDVRCGAALLSRQHQP